MTHIIDTSILIRQTDSRSADQATAINALSTVEAEAERLRLEAVYPRLPDPSGVYERWVSLVNQYGVSGKPTHDARIAAAMLEHGLTHILTFNIRDFQRYSTLGIVAVDPTSVHES